MTRPRTDGNQADIIAALEAAGASVAITTGVKRGFPDLCVGYNGRTFMLEVKQDGGRLTGYEIAFMATWRGDYHVVRCPEDALRIIGR